MSCLICQTEPTVRSHILPKAFALDVRDGASHAVAASSQYSGAKPVQGGAFTDKILCMRHEAVTAAVDKYAIEFVRRLISESAGRRSNSFGVPNPIPAMLRRFAILTIWREVHSGQTHGLSLGTYERQVREYLFDSHSDLDWPLIVQKTTFSQGANDSVKFNLHPYRVRFLDRGAWMFVVSGVTFLVISDQQSLPLAFDEWRADKHNPALITVSERVPLTEVGALKTILRRMAAATTRP